MSGKVTRRTPNASPRRYPGATSNSRPANRPAMPDIKEKAMRTLLLAITLAAASLASAHGEKSRPQKAPDYGKTEQHPFGRAADPKNAKRTIRVDMTDQMRFHPAE